MIQSLRWELSSEYIPKEIDENLSANEKIFRLEYNDILRAYMNKIDVDLTLVCKKINNLNILTLIRIQMNHLMN